MEFLLVLIATPIAVWLLDFLLYRGEFTQAVREAIQPGRNRKKTRK